MRVNDQLAYGRSVIAERPGSRRPGDRQSIVLSIVPAHRHFHIITVQVLSQQQANCWYDCILPGIYCLVLAKVTERVRFITELHQFPTVQNSQYGS